MTESVGYEYRMDLQLSLSNVFHSFSFGGGQVPLLLNTDVRGHEDWIRVVEFLAHDSQIRQFLDFGYSVSRLTDTFFGKS